MIPKKKLIEVALPLEAINKAGAREKSIRHGHPSTLHLWWARRPLAAARAVIFAQMVDDPSAHPDMFKTEQAQEKERQRLFRIIEDLVLWENTTNETVLQRARDEIRQSRRYTCAERREEIENRSESAIWCRRSVAGATSRRSIRPNARDDRYDTIPGGAFAPSGVVSVRSEGGGALSGPKRSGRGCKLRFARRMRCTQL